MCPMCGTAVNSSAAECPGCGEPFSTRNNGDSDFTEETVTEVTEEFGTPDIDTNGIMVPESGECDDCGTKLSADGSCPTCGPAEKEISKGTAGCPACGNKEYSLETGDLVSCVECGNVYVREPFVPAEQSWKWKFWVGFVFIMVGNVGVALGSYIHNVAQWSPLGAMYLGYGWIDQIVGIIGIVLFIVGLILFAWSFKRDREVTCPNCKVTVREEQLIVYEPEEEEILPDHVAVKSALEEIGEMAECPSCGASVSMFDTSCGNCGAVFETDLPPLDMPDEVPSVEKVTTPGRRLSASEIDEDELIMNSLELETPQDELNGNGLNALNELETAFEMSLADKTSAGIACPTCGATVGRGLDTCPGCGEPIPAPKKGKGGE